MLKRLLILVCFGFSIQLNAQTGIGTTSPNASAKLDVYSDNKGFLPPRVTLTSSTDNTTIPSPAEGLLVYNKGSVGLQAGYYYWNGANWTIIATSSVAGSGVVASDLVKLYGEVYSDASGKIAHANGFTFSVPVSGRYLFDFTSVAYANNASLTITFKVRQGTTDLGSDFQTSANNTVHVEYNGKIEVNLQSGITYNVFVTQTGGIRNNGDYDRVYMKQVAGNLPVSVYPWVLSGNDVYNNTGNVGIGTNTPSSKLDVSGDLKVSGTSNINYLTVGTGTGDEGGEFSLARAQTNQSLGGSVNVDVYRNSLRFFEGGGDNRGVSIDLSQTPNNVGGELVWKKSGFVNAGTDVICGNLKARIPTSGNRSLQLSTVSGTYSVYGSDIHYAGGVGGSNINASTPLAITTSPTYLNSGLSFNASGYNDVWNIMDTSSQIAWRITMIIGSGYVNNFISIERLK